MFEDEIMSDAEIIGLALVNLLSVIIGIPVGKWLKNKLKARGNET